jgi:predicted DNA-binding transcriptional regulator YafY
VTRKKPARRDGPGRLPGSYTQGQRLLDLWDRIRQGAPLQLAFLAQHYRVTERSIRRDVGAIRGTGRRVRMEGGVVELSREASRG